MDPLTLTVAKRAAAAQEARYLKGILAILQNTERWLAGFPRVLAAAQRDDLTGLNPGEVWQDKFSRYWKPWHKFSSSLGDLAYELNDGNKLLVRMIQDVTYDKSGHGSYNPNDKKQFSYAFGNPLWRPHPMGQDHIAYEEKRLEDWHEAATKWAKDTEKEAKKALRRASR